MEKLLTHTDIFTPKNLKNLLVYIVLSIYCLIILLPIFWVILGSFKRQIQLHDLQYFFRFSPTLENYQNLFYKRQLGPLFLNSIIVSCSATLITIPLAYTAAYALSRFRIKGSQAISIAFLSAEMLPSIALSVALYAIFRKAGLLNTLQGLIIAHTTFSLPFSIWILRAFLLNVPKEYEDSAMIDGCSKFKAMYKIIFPLSAPGIITAALFIFLNSWGEFTFALTLTIDKSAQTAPIGIASLISAYGIDWGGLLAGSTILIIPMLVFVLFAQKFLIEGLVGGIKE